MKQGRKGRQYKDALFELTTAVGDWCQILQDLLKSLMKCPSELSVRNKKGKHLFSVSILTGQQ